MRAAALCVVLGLSGLLGAGCASDQQGSPSKQLSNWVTGTDFAASTGQIRADVAKATTLQATTENPDAAHTLCGALLVEIQQANQTLPSPDTPTTNLLGASYESLGAAAHDCYDAVGNPAKQTAFANDRRAGLFSLTEAQLRIEAVLGKRLILPSESSPSTTAALK